MIHCSSSDKNITISDHPTISERITRYWLYAQNKLHKKIEDNIPVEDLKNHPWFSKYTLGLITIVGYYAVLIYLTWVGYLNSAGSTFMSLSYGTNPCNPVARPLTGNYYATYDGIWEGQPGFFYNQSMYIFKFNNFVNFTNPKYEKYYSVGPAPDHVKNHCDYVCLMKVFEAEMLGVLKKASNQPLSLNL